VGELRPQGPLPRINGFELMMAPYIVSHLRLGLALQETGFTFTKNDRLRVFLTNTLEMHTEYPKSQLSFIGSSSTWRRRPQLLGRKFAQFDAIDAVFSPNGRPAPGFLTTHDDFAIAFTREEISDHVSTLLASRSEADARDQFKLCTQSQWHYANAKKVLATGGWRKQLVSCLYRPFDERWTVYDPSVLVHRRERVNAHLLEPGNVAILTTRMTKGDNFNHVFLTDKITDITSLSSKTSTNAFVFPLFLGDTDGLVKRSQPNIDRRVMAAYTNIAGKAATPMAMFEYWYAVLSSPSYRRRYNELLIREFPRVPRPSSAEVFKALGEHGKRLVELHLLKTSPKSLGLDDGLQGNGDGVVAAGMPKFDAKEGKLWINARQWFGGVSAAVWGFKIGSYEVCKKWLSARRGRTLSSDESRRFALVLNALRGTLEEQSKIDRTIETFGGWPNAFQLVAGATAASSLSHEGDDE
jgi:hypothetical protein